MTISNNKMSPRTGSHRYQLIAVVGIVISVMLFLSIISYSSEDQSSGEIRLSDIWKIFKNDEYILIKAERTHNLLGLFGAIVSNWLINSTVGYFVIVFPFLGLIWSIYLLNKKNLHRKIVLTNYLIILTILLSAFSGLWRQLNPSLSTEWSGVVGVFIAHVLINLIGTVGAFLLIGTGFIIVIALLIDLDFAVTMEKLKSFYWSIIIWSKSKINNYRKNKSEKRKIEFDEKDEQFPVHIKKPDIESREQIIPRANKPVEQSSNKISKEYVAGIHDVGEFERGEQNVKRGLTAQGIGKTSEDIGEVSATVSEDREEEIDYVFPSVDLLDARRGTEEINEDELKANAELLRMKLSDFSVEIENVSVTPGPVVTLYELVPAPGVKISKIESLQDDIALALKAKGIRIIAPMPGKGTVGVEIPNHNPSLVTVRSVINSAKFRDTNALIPIAMGKTISGEVYVDDLAKMPHLLIAGATGSGKSVGINTIIISILYKLHPSDVKFVIIDPKKIELAPFRKLRNHYLAVSPDIEEEIVTEPNNAVLILKSVELEMENRYDKLASAGVRDIVDYNRKLASERLNNDGKIGHKKLPYLIVVIDELADLMITAAREIEEPIARLAQLARAVGIHLVVATQRPSVDVITGVIKANFPARIAYQVSSKIDSRTILDMNGAEQLLGAGDMLYLPAGSPKPERIQNAFISIEEVERVVSYIHKQKGYATPFILPSVLEKRRISSAGRDTGEDELFEEAARIIVRHQQGSVSLLQRRLKIGYSRAARLIDELEAAGIVGPFDGSKAREVLIENETELENILKRLKT